MSDVKTIAVAGVSEQEVAHLRLLIRKSAEALAQGWRWGEEGEADLLVIDPDVFAGQMARTRAQGVGVRCAVFSDRVVEGADLVLRRPLTRANLVEVLNRAATRTVPEPEIASATRNEDFYSRDLGEDSTPPPAIEFAAPVDGLDEALRPQPLELREMVARDAPVQRVAIPADATRKYATREAMLEDTAPRELRDFLEQDLLRRPARYVLAGSPAFADSVQLASHRADYGVPSPGAALCSVPVPVRKKKA